MRKIIIGSTAIKHWFPDFPRNPKDLDIAVIDSGEWPKEKGVEYLENKELFWKQWLCLEEYLIPNALLTLKISHLIGWDINWEKHMFDVQFLLKKGCILYPSLFNDLYKLWEEVHGKNKRSDLDMTADEFFDNAVKFPIPHDELHYILKDTPTFTKVLKDGAEVEVDENKFRTLSFEDKCSLVTEEVMVMALERYESLGFQRAYSKMLKKFILYHAPIWEALFIIENYIELHKPKFDYFKKIENGIRIIKQATS